MHVFTVVKRLIFAIIAILLITGCTPWPTPGTGGMAEVTHAPLPAAPVNYARVTPYDMTVYRLTLNRYYLQSLKSEGAARCFPGQWEETNQWANRVSRELFGGLTVDADNDLLILENKINSLQHRMTYLGNRANCKKTTSQSMKSLSMGK